MMADRLYISQPTLSGNERTYVLDCLDTNQLSGLGPYVRRFEEFFAATCGTHHAVTCCNGTAALHLALLAFGIGPGDDVFIPALTYVATANAVKYVGANPVFCDVDPNTWCLDPRSVEFAIKQSLRPAAIIPVHLYGVPVDVRAFERLAGQYGLTLIFDAAEALGATYDGLPIGSFGHASTFSFYGNKIITAGEGGMVVVKNDAVAERLRLYRGQGQTRRYFHEVIGYNYRMTNLQAAVGLAQLERLYEHLSHHRLVQSWYRQVLRGVTFQEVTEGATSANWLCTVLLPRSVDRNATARYLEENNIETRPIFVPITDMPPYRQRTPSVTAELGARGISLPTHCSVFQDDTFYVARSLQGAIQHLEKKVS